MSPAYARLMKALRGDKVAQFEKAVATLDDKAALMRLHGAQRQTILHEAAAQGQKSIVLWLLRGYATAIDHVQVRNVRPMCFEISVDCVVLCCVVGRWTISVALCSGGRPARDLSCVVESRRRSSHQRRCWLHCRALFCWFCVAY